MRTRTSLNVFCVLTAFFGLLALTTFGAIAQSRPPGSYQRVCIHIRTEGPDLKATCPMDNNVYGTPLGSASDARRGDGNRPFTFYTLHDYRSCIGDIWFNNRQLNCRRAVSGNTPPEGTYRRACSGVSVNGADLHALCALPNGVKRRAVLTNFRNCRGDIYVINAKMRCR